MIANGYCTLGEFKAALGIATSSNDAFIEECIETASRDIDAHCGRRFYLDANPSARSYQSLNQYEVWTDDMGAAPTAVKTDTGDDGGFATTWASTDYVLKPWDGIGPNGQTGWPYSIICAVEGNTFPVIVRPNNVQVTARWGWAAVPTPIKTACRRLAQLDYEARNAPFGTAGIGDLGIIRLKEDILADRHMLPFVDKDILVA